MRVFLKQHYLFFFFVAAFFVDFFAAFFFAAIVLKIFFLKMCDNVRPRCYLHWFIIIHTDVHHNIFLHKNVDISRAREKKFEIIHKIFLFFLKNSRAKKKNSARAEFFFFDGRRFTAACERDLHAIC